MYIYRIFETENTIKEIDLDLENKEENKDEIKLKKYEYKKYIAPKIDINKYFSKKAWIKRCKELLDKKKNKLIPKNRIKYDKKTKKERILVDKGKDTFIINEAKTFNSIRKFKLNLYMIEEFGLKLEELIIILEASAKGSSLAQKLKEFLQIEMPKGFPKQLGIYVHIYTV